LSSFIFRAAGFQEIDPKNNQLEFYPRKLRKPLLSLKVDKVVGGKPSKKSKIIFKVKYYDMTHDRLNLFV